jgi:transposase-like protein
MGILKEKVLPESMVFTDEMPSYNLVQMQNKGYIHRRIKHASKVYVVGDVHTNTIEGFWSLIKRGIGGVYHQVSRKYLQTYLDEYSYRYNRRHTGNLIFTSLLGEASKRAV